VNGIHVGVIMDGNGRWARMNGQPRWRGHVAGVDAVRDVVEGAPDLGISTLTLYAFSTANWTRPPTEVGRLFWLLREYCQRERAELIDNGVRVTAIGRRDRIPHSALREVEKTEHETAGGRRLHLRLAIDYGARWAIANAARTLAASVTRGELQETDITPERLHQELTGGVPDPDLIVRTAGEQRLSDFLLWEAAYAEYVFTDTLWPDFRRADLAMALSEFSQRERRFGSLQSVRGAGRLVG
jgi:undecaprenyl diphosphate synthase